MWNGEISFIFVSAINFSKKKSSVWFYPVTSDSVKCFVIIFVQSEHQNKVIVGAKPPVTVMCLPYIAFPRARAVWWGFTFYHHDFCHVQWDMVPRETRDDVTEEDDVTIRIDLIHKSQNAPVPYTTMLHSEQKCAHFCSEWSIVGYGTGAFWDLWNWSILVTATVLWDRAPSKAASQSTMDRTRSWCSCQNQSAILKLFCWFQYWFTI